MSSINADNGVVSGITGVRVTADSTGNLALQSNGVTALTLATNNTATFANSVTVTGALTTAGNAVATTNQVIGISQTMTDVKASRVLGTTYTNSTGKPIVVYTSISNTNASAVGQYQIDGVTFWGTSIPTANGYYSMTMVVPNGSTYVVNMNGTPTLQYWAEIR